MKLFTVILLFFSTYLYGQNPDSLTQRSIQNELEAIKIFRQKDSIRIAMLLNEIQEMLHADTTSKTLAKDSLASIGKEKGLALNVHVKVRYDYSDNLVEELLIEAALITNGISPHPHPYIFQLSLDERNALYELNAYTFHPENMYFIKSDLVKNIQSTFRQANVEIFSTQYVDILPPNELRTKKK